MEFIKKKWYTKLRIVRLLVFVHDVAFQKENTVLETRFLFSLTSERI
jgi:hypothetical protein